jgi:ribonucleotide monophosphatase NagD (HAD superfamily)
LVVGSDGLRAELEAVGIEAVDASKIQYDDFSRLDRLERIGAVVVGATTAFDYSQLAIASLYLGSSCLFVATNMDAYDVVGGDKRRLPGNGCLVEAISVATGRPPVR